MWYLQLRVRCLAAGDSLTIYASSTFTKNIVKQRWTSRARRLNFSQFWCKIIFSHFDFVSSDDFLLYLFSFFWMYPVPEGCSSFKPILSNIFFSILPPTLKETQTVYFILIQISRSFKFLQNSFLKPCSWIFLRKRDPMLQDFPYNLECPHAFQKK